MLPTTDVGPIVNETQLKRVHGYTKIGLREGAKLLCGGEISKDGECRKGFFYTPTLFVGGWCLGGDWPLPEAAFQPRHFKNRPHGWNGESLHSTQIPIPAMAVMPAPAVSFPEGDLPTFDSQYPPEPIGTSQAGNSPLPTRSMPLP